jgi:carbohydrate-selective porin OprB
MRQHDHRYRGVRAGPAGIVSVDGRPLPVTARAARLAPEGFAWGSQTNGALALAHALLAYEVDTRTADAAFEAFAREVITTLPQGAGGEAWRLTSAELGAWLEAHRRATEPDA